MRALITLNGATSESTTDAMPLCASSSASAPEAMGDRRLSVIATTRAPLEQAYCRVFAALLE